MVSFLLCLVFLFHVKYGYMGREYDAKKTASYYINSIWITPLEEVAVGKPDGERHRGDGFCPAGLWDPARPHPSVRDLAPPLSGKAPESACRAKLI